jgi:hypothetical protein
MRFYPLSNSMKPSSSIIVASALVVALAACEQSGNSGQSNSGRNRFGYRGTVENAEQTQFATPTPTPNAYETPAPTPDPSTIPAAPTPTPPPAPTTGREIAYGTPVPGKAGFVTSPHSPYAGYVDVRGFPPGTEVKCPYSGKIFLVP